MTSPGPDDALLRDLARRLLGDDAEPVRLHGEHDLNARVEVDGRRLLMKVHAVGAGRAAIAMQDRALTHLATVAPGLPVPRLLRSEDVDGRVVRLLSWLDGRPWNLVATPDGHGLGRLAGEVDWALGSLDAPAPVADPRWRMTEALALFDRGIAVPGWAEGFVEEARAELADSLAPALAALPRQLVHNDGNEQNLLADEAGRAVGLIDLGDLDVAPRICSAATMATYAALHSRDPQAGLVRFVVGYHRGLPLTRPELDLLPGLVRTRLAMSILNAVEQGAAAPDNPGLVVTQEPIRRLLPSLGEVLGPFCRARLRDACGYAATDGAFAVVRWLGSAEARPTPVLPGVVPGATAAPIAEDALTVDEGEERDGHDRHETGGGLVTGAGAPSSTTRVVAGGYGHDRLVYRAPEFSVGSDEPRTVHLAIDVMGPAGTPVASPFDGVVEAAAYRGARLDYGGVAMVRHRTPDGTPFWLLHGHLAADVVDRLRPGQEVRAGETLGVLGAPEENGHWEPHLHLQVFTDLLGRSGEDVLDLPGVVRLSERDAWLAICPDPNLVLRLVRPGGQAEARQPQSADALARRRASLSAALSLSYAHPLEIVAGEGAELVAADGRRYLDLVNNVAHVGHCHPRVVAATVDQVGRLNTNTRYLHPAIAEYARRLAATLPDPLTTVFLTNSGSEANDLALRLARAATGRRTVLALEHGYHGNLTSLVDISHYKCCGPGGQGPGPGVAFGPLPDAYRGPDVATALAGLDEAAQGLVAAYGGIGAFIHESISGVAGQVELAEGYLPAAYDRVRALGGVVVADEVQTGFGRLGEVMWAFERHGVVPDVVTMGKPIGNGHPLGAVVCTPEVARAFETGMEYFNTFGGNPVSARVGLAVLDTIEDEGLRAHAAAVGARFKQGLAALRERHECVGDVRGHGLFLGVELVRDRASREPHPELAAAVVEHAVREGVLLSVDGPEHNVLKIKPPLVVTEEQVDRAVTVIDAGLAAGA